MKRWLPICHPFAHFPELTKAEWALLSSWINDPRLDKRMGRGEVSMFEYDWFVLKGRDHSTANRLLRLGLLVTFNIVQRPRANTNQQYPIDKYVTQCYRPLDWVIDRLREGIMPLVKGIPHSALPETKQRVLKGMGSK